MYGMEEMRNTYVSRLPLTAICETRETVQSRFVLAEKVTAGSSPIRVCGYMVGFFALSFQRMAVVNLIIVTLVPDFPFTLFAVAAASGITQPYAPRLPATVLLYGLFVVPP